MLSSRRSRARAIAAAATVAVAVPLGVVAAGAPASAATNLGFTRTWQVTLPDAGHPIAGSSPAIATIDGGGPVVLVGDRAGYEYAVRLATGKTVWRWSSGGVPIDSTASVLRSGSAIHINVGVGNSSRPHAGAYMVLNSQGRKIWSVHAKALPTGSSEAAVSSSMTVATLQGAGNVVSGALGQMGYAMDINGHVLTGFPWFEADTNFATPATVDPTHRGADSIVMGGDSTAGIAFGYHYTNGGHIRIVQRLGNHRATTPAGGLQCQYNTTQVVQSSPAVGTFLPGGGTGIVAGTGTYFQGASDTNKLIAVDTGCHLRWKADLHAPTVSSPALADVLGNHTLAVVEGTRASAASGTVYALNGANGHAYWSRPLPGGVYGGVTTADLRGTGHQDVVVPTTGGTWVLDGKTGAVIGTVQRGIGVQSSALITRDPNGRTGITIAGYNAHNQGVIAHYQLNGVYRSTVNVKGAWPMFHHDSRLTGNAYTSIG